MDFDEDEHKKRSLKQITQEAYNARLIDPFSSEKRRAFHIALAKEVSKRLKFLPEKLYNK